jgi:cobalt/nickel transport system permease protein
MHIPDGFVNAPTAVATGLLGAGGLAVALNRIRAKLPSRRIPLLGLAAAFIFAGQMLNFPVAGGTSGHLIGAVLAAALLGPSAAVLVMSAVLILQCFMFADGGLTALGANVFNMGIVAVWVGYGVYALIRRWTGGSPRGTLLAVAFASWCSTVMASIACAGELASSGTVAWGVAFPAMAGVHMLIGIGEALITALVVSAVAKLRPELIEERADPAFRPGYGELIIFGVLVSFGLVIFISPFACGWPDGLEKVAGSLGFAPRAAEKPVLPSPFADYTIPGIGSEWLSTVLAGVIGAAIAFVLAWLWARLLTPESGRHKVGL